MTGDEIATALGASPDAVAGTGTGISSIPSNALAVMGNHLYPRQAVIANTFVCGLHNGQLQVYVGLASSYFMVDVTACLQ